VPLFYLKIVYEKFPLTEPHGIFELLKWVLDKPSVMWLVVQEYMMLVKLVCLSKVEN
jgi:hypothetical protein